MYMKIITATKTTIDKFIFSEKLIGNIVVIIFDGVIAL